MPTLYFLEGFAFSLSAYVAARLSELPFAASKEGIDFRLLLIALLPVWMGLATAAARIARQQSKAMEWEYFARAFHAHTSGFDSASKQEWLLNRPNVSFASAPSDVSVVWTCAGGLAGALPFAGKLAFSVVAWALLAGMFIAMGVAHQMRRKQLRMKREARAHGRFQAQLCAALDGMRTWSSLGARRFAERKIEEKFHELAEQEGSIAQGLESDAFLRGMALLLIGASGALAVYTQSASSVHFLFLMACMVYAALPAAKALLAWQGRRRVETAPLPLPKPLPALPDLSSVERFCFKNVFVESGGFKIGPIDAEVRRGAFKLVTQPDQDDLYHVLSAIAGLAPCSSGTIEVYDTQTKRVYSQAFSGTACFSTEWAAYWERQPVFFHASVRENLVFGNPLRLSDLQLWNMLEWLGADGLVRELGGLDHLLHPEECVRSEKLLLSLARVLLAGRPLLVMEHPAFVGEFEWLYAKLQKLPKPPALIVGKVMGPTIGAGPLGRSAALAQWPPAAAHGAP
jgi:ABC-type multidrug transport system fused ATPase/permease subunit